MKQDVGILIHVAALPDSDDVADIQGTEGRRKRRGDRARVGEVPKHRDEFMLMYIFHVKSICNFRWKLNNVFFPIETKNL